MNSSSCIIEAPSFKIGTINIGDRQKGRIKANSIIDCLPNKESIKNAIEYIYSEKFQTLLKKTENPYGKGNYSKKVVKVLKTKLNENLLKKSFYNLYF